MNIVTAQDVRNMFANFIRTAKSHGIDAEHYALTTGSATYGNAYRVVNRDPVMGGESIILHLGFTKREAYDRLYTAAETLHLLPSGN